MPEKEAGIGRREGLKKQAKDSEFHQDTVKASWQPLFTITTHKATSPGNQHGGHTCLCSFLIISNSKGSNHSLLFLKLCNITVLFASHFCENYEGRCTIFISPSPRISSPTQAPLYTNGLR